MPPEVPSEIERKQASAAPMLTLADVQAAPVKHSYLEHGIDSVTSLAISNDKTRQTVNHYAGEIIKTATLFAAGRVGIGGAMLAYGLDQASPEDKLGNQLADFGLGAAKGGVMKGLFNTITRDFSFAPAKGVLMGITSRDAEILFSRETFTDPSKTWANLKAETINPQAWLLDAATFAVGEGLFRGVNNYTGGMIAKSPVLSGMAMGSSFGFVSGGTGEIMRAKAAGEEINIRSVLEHGLLEAGVQAVGAGLGVKASDPAFHASLRANLKVLTNKAEHVIHGGPDTPLPFVDARQSDFEAHKMLRKQLKLLTLHAPNKGESGAAEQIVNAARNVEQTKGGETKSSEGDNAPLLPGLKRNRILKVVGDVEPGAVTTKTDAVTGKHQVTVNVMGPLEVGNAREPNAQSSRTAWAEFGRQLEEAKKLGADAVSTDVWWGVVESKPGKYNWEYYDILSKTIMDHGLKWVPILSFHQCGGNIGDTSYIPVPFWLWNSLDAKLGKTDAAKFVSEQGNKSNEYISFWATEAALSNYKSLMQSFQQHFGGRAHNIAEINVSLGPAGEARFPSYNSHDNGAGYPNRGALQAYSEIAVESFRKFAIEKYGSIDALAQAWGIKPTDPIRPPDNAEFFFQHQDHRNTQYGRDFFDWYNKSLIDHGTRVLGAAVEVFGAKDAAFAGVDIGAKIPGVHWRVGEWQGDKVIMGDRLAELNAGLIKTSNISEWMSDDAGRGYRPILTMFSDLQKRSPYSRIVPHFTALELRDGQDGVTAKALPFTLATWVGMEAQRQGLPLKGENALAWTLPDPASWDRMQSLIKTPNGSGYYHGLTILRISDVVGNETARARLQQLLDSIKSTQPAQEKTGT